MRLSRVVVFLIFCVALLVPLESSGEEVIRLAGWPQPVKYAGITFAQSNGAYRDQGLDVQLVPTFQDPFALLLSGNADMIVALASQAITAKAEGHDVVIVGVLDQELPIATMSLASSGIRGAKDFEGRVLAVVPGNAPEERALSGLASLGILDANKVRILPLAFSAQMAALLSGQVDLVPAWYGSGLAAKQAAATSAGVQVDVQRWKDFGLVGYGDSIITTRQWANSHIDQLRGFLLASREGYQEFLKADSNTVLRLIEGVDPSLKPRHSELATTLGQVRTLLQPAGGSALLSVDATVLEKTRSLLTTVPAGEVNGFVLAP